MDFENLIKTESAKLRELHAEIHRTFERRDRDKRSWNEWSDACKAYHSYVSALDSYLQRACNDDCYVDRDLIEFVVCFLEADAWFFRSGYLKQILLTRLKRSYLNESTKSRLRRVLVDAVNRRGTREFKYYCRLAAVISNEHLISELESALAGKELARSNRARIMIQHISQRQAASRYE